MHFWVCPTMQQKQNQEKARSLIERSQVSAEKNRRPNCHGTKIKLPGGNKHIKITPTSEIKKAKTEVLIGALQSEKKTS